MGATEFVDEVLREAGRLLLDLQEGSASSATRKRGADLVTAADRCSEALILRALRGRYPRDAVLAEESGALSGDPDRVWVVDPLDGTGNYVRGLRPWGVTMALVVRGAVVVGGFHDPLAGTTVLAERGGGAWMDGQRLVTGGGPTPVAVPTVGLSASAPPLRDEARALLNAMWDHGAELRMSGCGAAALASVARGRLSAFVEIDGGPWDYAAGALAVREAGGRATTLTGGEVDHTSTTVLAAGDAALHAELAGLVGEVRGNG
ncbi:myo-inositol-1(or 4)-monophosphatase [Saccharothrix saharensis]|uniref:Myo-inositol-1(Or 4)-monophosphatase n=1 Tax=Saccharothrix saharensis TaxID=571190 RepID=A0A543J835_9PSEU|nr:inositol monophosphatase [Saccharothrix saharensis]TQM78995.1 myo-inositol-1(or 4)-monophosphatase [Saccharothrix saharensis]